MAMALKTGVVLRMKQTNVRKDLSATPGTEHSMQGSCYVPHSRYFRMKGMTHDQSLKPEELRILSEAEQALPQRMHENTRSRTCEQAEHAVGKQAGRQGGPKALVGAGGV